MGIISKYSAIISGCRTAEKGGNKPCSICPHYESPTWESPGGCTCDVDEDSQLPCMNGSLEEEAYYQIEDYEDYMRNR